MGWLGMELGRSQHLLQSWSLGRLARRLSSAQHLVSPTPHRVGQSSWIRRKLGLSATQLPPSKPHPPAWLCSARRSSRLQPPRSFARQSARKPSRQPPIHTAGKWQSSRCPAGSTRSSAIAARYASSAKPSGRQSVYSATGRSAITPTETKQLVTSFEGEFSWTSPASIGRKTSRVLAAETTYQRRDGSVEHGSARTWRNKRPVQNPISNRENWSRSSLTERCC